MEPTLHQIEDYNGNESSHKRFTVNMVIAGLFLVGFIYAGVKNYYNSQTTTFYTPVAEKSN